MKLSIIVAAVCSSLFVWSVYGEVIKDIFWSVRHQNTMSFRGQSLRLPYRWREREWTNYNNFELTHDNSGFSTMSSIMVHYLNFTPEDAEKAAQREKTRSEETQRDLPQLHVHYDFHNDTDYMCRDTVTSESPVLSTDCWSRDGRWDVSFFGLKRDRSDFETILHEMASMGTPSK